MSSFTHLLQFKLSNDSKSPKGRLLQPLNEVDQILTKHRLLLQTSQTNELSAVTAQHYVSSDGRCHGTVRGLPPDLIVLDLHEYKPAGEPIIYTDEVITRLQGDIGDVLQPSKSSSLPAIRRGGDIDVYFPTTDGKLIEYDFDKTVFHAKSDFQDVRIMHSKQFGNMLLLDEDPNLAESDIAYTKAITGNDLEDYAGKTVLILGGGDGGILHELRHKQPQFITMIEIDPVVLDLAKKHLRGICHDSLDQLEGDNYKVIVADCIPVLKQFVKQNQRFDFIINDLTAIPVTTEPKGDHWDFMRLILDLSMELLADTGRYYTQGNGANMVEALRMYEEQLAKLKHAVEFSKETVCVPSYHELWMFYKIWKKSSSS